MDLPSAAPSLAADYYRKHAARVRDLAVGTTTPALKEHLYDLARQYDELAESAEYAARIGARSS